MHGPYLDHNLIEGFLKNQDVYKEIGSLNTGYLNYCYYFR